jgi:hypothetical protein
MYRLCDIRACYELADLDAHWCVQEGQHVTCKSQSMLQHVQTNRRTCHELADLDAHWCVQEGLHVTRKSQSMLQHVHTNRRTCHEVADELDLDAH